MIGLIGARLLMTFGLGKGAPVSTGRGTTMTSSAPRKSGHVSAVLGDLLGPSAPQPLASRVAAASSQRAQIARSGAISLARAGR